MRTAATRVVAAVQSPTLLSILAKSSAWSLSAYPLGDHDGLAEAEATRISTWNDGDSSPEVVLVCSPAHLFSARAKWPTARIVWVVHNGRERWLLPAEHEDSVAGVICFSERLRWLCQAGRRPAFHFISPAYEARIEWTWAENRLWTLRNRPGTRSDDRENLIAAITQGASHSFYGQDQPTGFADADTSRALRGQCSAYVSALDRSAGFGLAEHEALAAGVPIIGGWWGDMEGELPAEYWGLQHNPRKMHEAAKRVASDESAAKELSALGLGYIAEHRSLARMNETIATLLRKL